MWRYIFCSGVVKRDLVRDVETSFHIRLLITASGNPF